MFQPFQLPATARSRVVTGPTPRLTAPLTRTPAVLNPFEMVPTPKYPQAGELVVSEADARPGGAPFPAIYSVVLGFDEETKKFTLNKGQVIGIHAETSAKKPKGSLGKRTRGFLAVTDGKDRMPSYMAVVAEQTVVDPTALVSVALAVEHTVTLDRTMLDLDETDPPLCPGTPLVIGIDENGLIKIRRADNTRQFYVYRAAIVTVEGHCLQACLTADQLHAP